MNWIHYKNQVSINLETIVTFQGNDTGIVFYSLDGRQVTWTIKSGSEVIKLLDEIRKLYSKEIKT